MKTEITRENEYTVPIPALNPSLCIIPDTLVLSFKFTNSNTKSWFLNNLGRTIIERLSVNIQGKEVYQCTGESMMEVYKDLWMSEEDRKNRQEFGIAENVRKLISKDDSANNATKTDGVLDLTVANMCDRMKIPLGKVLCNNEPYAPYGMCDFEYRITPPKSEKIMKAQDGEEVGEYKLTGVQLEYEAIESESLAKEVSDQYFGKRSLSYDYTTTLKTLSWSKSSTREVIDVNIPRKSMKAIVLFFTKNNSGDSEEFVFPELTKVNVTVEGNPNDIYSEGLERRDMYREASRIFGGPNYVSRREFYPDKFACVIDFRDDEDVSESGRKLIDFLEIEKEVTTTDLSDQTTCPEGSFTQTNLRAS